MQIATRNRRVLVTRDTLEDVQLYASVGHPCQERVAEPVTHQAGLADLADQTLPVSRIAHRGRGDDAAARSGQEPRFR
jgi:hypothetical protein